MKPSRRTRPWPAVAALFLAAASWCSAATVYWTGDGADGSWHTATNWREGDANGAFDPSGAQRLPTSGDTAVIDDGDPNTTTTVAHSQAVTTDLAALASAETVQLTVGTIAFGNTATVGDAGGLVLIAGGSLSMDNGGTITSDVTITSGELTLSNSAVLAGSLVAQGGTVEFANTASITGSVLLQGASLSLANGTALSGTMTVESGDLALSNNADLTGDVIIEGGNVSLDNGASVSDFTVSGGSLTLTNNAEMGEFTMTGGDVTLGDGADVTSLGITGGSITFAGTATVADITVDGGALEFQGATTVSGSMAVTDGIVTVADGASLDAASLSISGGTFNVAAGATLSATSMEVSGGTVTIDGDASFDSLSVTGGTISGAGFPSVPRVDFSVSASTLSEEAGSVTLTADLTDDVGAALASALDIAIVLSVAGVATKDADYSIAGTNYVDGTLTLTIPGGVGNTSGAVTITGISDALHEGSEDVILGIAAISNALAGTTTSQTLTVTDDDAAPTVTFDAATSTPDEGAGSVSVGVSLSAASGLAVTVPYTVSGTAAGGSVDHNLADGSLTIAVGATTGSIGVAINADDLDEDNETVVVTMDTGSLGNATAGATTVHTLTIVDDDATPTVTFGTDAQTVSEADAGVNLTVDLSAVSGRDVTIPYTVGGASTASAGDHDLVDSSVVITAGSPSGTINFTTVDDALDEDPETVVIVMTTASLVNATAGAITAHTVTLTDDDATPTVTFAVSEQTVAEADGAVSMSVELSAVSGRDVTVPYTVGGTALGSGTDHDLADGSLTIGAGSPTGAISLNLTPDGLDEDDETIIVSITTAGLINATEGGVTGHTITVTDADSAPAVTFAVDAQSVAEGDGSVSISVDLAAASGLDATIPYTVSGAAAASPTDHDLVDGSLVIGAGEFGGTITFTVADDALHEAAETIVVTITTGSLANASEGAITVHTVTITDNDDAPSVTFDDATSTADEDAGPLTIGVTLSAMSGLNATIPFAVSGTATGSGTDYTFADSSLTITAGSTVGSISVTIAEDALDEGDEEIVVDMTTESIVNASAGAETSHTLTITDNDDPPTVTFDAATSIAAEGVGAIAIGITLSGESGLDATIPYTVSGSATALGTDHDLAAGFLTISAGSTGAAFDFTLSADTLDELDETVEILLTEASLVNVSAGATTSHTLTITDDDDPPTVTFDAATSAAVEGDGAVAIGVTLSTESGLDATIPYTVSGTATTGTDHGLADGFLTIPAGSPSGAFDFTLSADTLFEVDETIVVSLTEASLVNVSAGLTTIHTLTIADDDSAPAVTFDAALSEAAEGTGLVTIGVTLGALSDLEATIPYTVSGTATGSATDHDLADGFLTIPVGATAADVSLTLTDDALDELDETVVVAITTGSLSNASIGAVTTHTLTITDDDLPPSVTFVADAQTSGESVAVVAVTATLSAPSGLDVTVPYTVGGTATGAGIDHDLVSGSLVIDAETDGGAITFTVEDDSLDEPDETVIVAMTTGSLVNATDGAVTTHTVTVTDNDETSVTFAATSQSVTESTSAIGIAVTLSVANASDVTIPYTVSGSASGGSVDHSLDSGSLTIAAETTFSSITAALNDDTLDENDETIIVTMETASLVNAVEGAVTVHTVTLTDDDDPPTVSFVDAGQTLAEAAAGTVEVMLSGASGLDVTVPYTVTGTATGSATDHDLGDGSFVIPAGSTTASVDLTVTGDALDELNETIVVSITTGALTNASAGTTAVHTVTITDDDDPPAVAFTATEQTVTEAAGTVTATVTLDALSGLDVTVPYTVSGTATGGATDHGLADSSVTIGAGTLSATIDFTVTDDAIDEPDETVIVSMTTPSLVNASAGAATTHTVTVTDNDEALVAFAAADQIAAESAGTVAVAVTLSIESAFDVTIPYTVSGSAVGGSVDHAFANGSLTIPAGTTIGSIAASVIDDALDENDETIVVTMTTESLVNAAAGGVTAHTVTLSDNDATPSVAFSAGAQTRSESIGSTTVTVYLSAESGLDVTVPYTVSGSATGSGTDYDIADSSLTIAAGVTSGDIAVDVTSDTLHEVDETAAIVMTVGSLTNATAGIITTHTLTITDDDDPPSVSFSLSAQSVTEGAGSVSIAVSLSALSGLDVTAPYTVAGTATGSGTDHDLADNSLVIGAGSLGGTITFALTDDALDEPDESVIVSLTTESLTNASAGAADTHTVTITDNDEVAVAFAASSQTAAEAAGSVAIAVTLSIESTFDVTVPYTVSGSAGSGDHDLVDGSLTIAAGATFDSIAAAITDDALDEDNESILVSITTESLVNATAGAFTTHSVSLIDDDAMPTVAFSTDAQTVSESVGSVSFAATLSAVSGRAVTVPYTVGGTATGGGVDHDLAASTITIPAGDPSVSESLTVVDDTTEEGDETVVVALDVASLANATEGGQSSHTVTITDNDTPPVGTSQAVTTAEDTPVAITLAGTDGDGDALTYTVTTEPSHGTLSGPAPDVTYTPTGDYAGADAFGFTVNDGQTDAAEATVTVTVTEVNDAPTLPALLGQTVAEDAGSVTITLAGLDAGGGSDEDGQSITITATSDTPAVVPDPTLTASPFTEGGGDPTLTFTPSASATGAATITVTAQDDGSTEGATAPESATGTFQVTVVPVSEASLTVSSGGESHILQFGFSANAADGLDTGFADRVSSASGSVIGAAFSRGGASLERDIVATPTGSSLSWTLAVDALAAQDTDVTITWTQADVDALLSAAGGFNSAFLIASTSETYSLSAANSGFSTTVAASASETWTLTIEKSSVRTTQPVQISLTADRWHLLSLPGAGDLTPLAAYNMSAFTWDAGNEAYVEATDLSTVSAVASGLFLFSSETVTVPLELDVDAADARQAAVTLSPGWNLVGAPATQNDADIWGEAPASQLTDGAANRVFGYDGAGSYSAATTLTEGSGYWALNPDATASAVTVTQARHLNGSVTQYHATPDARVPDWSATLTLSGPSNASSSLTLGLSPEASAGYDSMDMPQPPTAVGAKGSAFYVATDDVVGRLTRSVQPAAPAGAEWSVVVQARGQTTLAWEGVSPPMGYRIALSTGDSEWDLRRRGSTGIGAGRHELTARLVPDVPATTALLPNYPNPFNPETWIPFELSEEADVRVEIYATTGELVRVLELGRRAPGRHTAREDAVHWDGRNSFGEPVASAPYLYVLRAGGTSLYGRMVVLK
ncbi:hypothetical protein CMK11_03630 [Candidatus Poribacteria bacterium]|nr:hypothetical protein [Candidatus Poribacteria bacterium]